MKIYRGAEGYSRGEGCIQDLTKIHCRIRATYQDTGLDCYPESGIRQNLGKKTIFGIAMTEVQDAGFSWNRGGKAGSGSGFPFQILIYHWNEVVPFFKAKCKQAKAPMRS